MSDFRGRSIVITGAASGLGKAWADGFLSLGAEVLATDIDSDGLQTLQEKGARTLTIDVSKKSAVDEMIDFALGSVGRIDVLFNNAGIAHPSKVEDLAEGDFEKHIEVHLYGAVYGMQSAIPHMRKQAYGRIINTISREAEHSGQRMAAYSAAKAGIWAATRSAARETADTDILINMLIPGPTNTAIWGVDMPQMQAAEKTFPTARMLAELETNGPSGKVFWDEKEYILFSQDNQKIR